MFRKLSAFILLCFLALGVSQEAYASHFRFGHTTWRKISVEQDGSIVVQFDSTQAWRTSALDILGIDFGDGDFFYPSDSDIINLLDATDIAGESYTIRKYSVLHTYSASDIASFSGRFLASQSDCCRIGSLINAGGASERIEILVDLNGGNTGSPVSTIPVIVQFAVGQTNALQIASADPDSDPVTCRMSTSPESSIPTLASSNGNNLSVGSNCLLQWDLSGTTLSNVGDKYAAQVTLEESNRCVQGACGKVALDFIIEVVQGNPPVCASNVPVNNTLYSGVPFNATFTGTDLDPGDVLTYSVLGAPADAISNPISGASQTAPFQTSLSWTPGESDKNSAYAILVSFQDQNGLQGTCSISLFVSPNDPPIQCIENDIVGSQFTLDGNAFAQLGLLKATLKKFKEAGGSKSISNSIYNTAKTAYANGWTATWTLPSRQFQCTQNNLCVSVSNASSLSDYIDASTKLHGLIKLAAKKYKKAAKKAEKSVKTSSISAENNAILNDSLAVASTVPASSDICPVM